jgi:hypothetical protein
MTTSTIPTTTTTTTTPVTTTDSITTTLAPTTTTAPVFTATVEDVGAETLAHSWEEGCPVGPEDLVTLGLSYWGFDDIPHQGALVVARDHSDALIGVFQALFEARYPIASMVPIGQLPVGAEDEPGYVNTSAFHCRPVKGATSWSEHAFGRAVDLNPHLNPYRRGDVVWPEGSERFLDRTLGEPGMIIEGDAVTAAFDAIGWGWGGRWSSLDDYHHFSATGR